MKKGGLLVFLILLGVLLVPVVSAFDANMVIKTKRPVVGVVIRVLDPSSGAVIDSVYAQTKSTGEAVANYSTTMSELSFLVLLVQNGQVKESKEFGPFPTISEIEMSFINETKVNEENLVEVDEGIIDNESEKSNETDNISEIQPESTILTGKVIAEDKPIFSGITYYLVSSIALAGIIGLFFIRRYTKIKKSTIPQTKSSNTSTPQQFQKQNNTQSTQVKRNFDYNDPKIRDAETRISELKNEIKQIRKQEEMEEAQKKFEEAQRELDRLRGNDDRSFR